MVKNKGSPKPAPGCPACRRWIETIPKLSGVDAGKLHARVCVPGAVNAETNKARYFSLSPEAIKARETEVLLTKLLCGVGQDDEPAAKPATVVAPVRVSGAEKRPNAPNAVEKPKTSGRAPRAKERPVAGNHDVFGFKAGSGAAQINTGISKDWKTSERIAADSKASRTVGGHLAKMVEIGYCEKQGKGPSALYRFTKKALALLKKS